MLRAALSRTPAASCTAHGTGCANQWRNVCLVGRQPIAQPCEEEQHSSATIRPPPRNTCAQDLVIGRRSLAQRAAHTISNWSASGCASLHEAATTIGATVREAANSRPPCAASAHALRAISRAEGRRHARRRRGRFQNFVQSIHNFKIRYNLGSNCIDKIRALALIPLLENNGVGSGSRLPGRSGKQNCPGDDQYNKIQTQYEPFIGCFSLITLLATRAWLQPELQKRRLFTVGGGRFVNQVHDRKRSPSDQPSLED
ncbi:hypothetical protein F511_38629 [Dorcoceras hygrometricum]|uniref:Uncharacterized protein n=1 Tax=Dorcoceras hygrometricum TaxID=472368 RepID=A0A2Z7A400_9LAMI|nr:hypothetical protein F511_38629 [Dorcoceras hygrometricum]